MTAARARVLGATGWPGPRAGRGTGVALLLLCSAPVLGAPSPAHAAERVVTITPSGVVPSRLEVAAGDTVRFVSQDPTFAYRAESTGGAWDFDSGPTELLDGDYLVPAPVVQPGTYTYRVAQDPPFSGAVVVPGAPAPAGSPAAPPSSAADSTSSGGSPAAGTAEPTGPAAGGAPPPAAPVPAVGDAEAPVARAVPGRLPGADTRRPLGLPVALAALLVLGTASLLLRLVLAEAALPDTALSGTRSDPSGRSRTAGGRAPRW